MLQLALLSPSNSSASSILSTTQTFPCPFIADPATWTPLYLCSPGIDLALQLDVPLAVVHIVHERPVKQIYEATISISANRPPSLVSDQLSSPQLPFITYRRQGSSLALLGLDPAEFVTWNSWHINPNANLRVFKATHTYHCHSFLDIVSGSSASSDEGFLQMCLLSGIILYTPYPGAESILTIFE